MVDRKHMQAANRQRVSLTFVAEAHVKIPVHQATAVLSQWDPAQAAR